MKFIKVADGYYINANYLKHLVVKQDKADGEKFYTLEAYDDRDNYINIKEFGSRAEAVAYLTELMTSINGQ